MLESEPCQCGSGLRFARCCGAEPATLPSPESAALLDAQAQAATKLFNEKKFAEAEALALKLLDLAPNQRLALRVLFEIRKAQTRRPAAEALARHLAALPGTPALRAAANSGGPDSKGGVIIVNFYSGFISQAYRNAQLAQRDEVGGGAGGEIE